MKDNNNAIDTMLCLQKVDTPTTERARPLYTWDDEYDARLGEASSEHDEQALTTISQCVKLFGHSATKELEEHTDFLQEEFLAHLEKLLQAHDISIQEKLTISLSSDNQLILQCEENEDAILTALGTDETLLKHLQTLRKAALVSRGLDYILAVQTKSDMEFLPPYRVCTKGALSHFYLTSRP